MPSNSKLFLTLGAISAAASVALAAVFAHVSGLQSANAAMLASALTQHQLHSIALLLVGVLMLRAAPSRWLAASGWLFAAGIVLFSFNFMHAAWPASTPCGPWRRGAARRSSSGGCVWPWRQCGYAPTRRHSGPQNDSGQGDRRYCRQHRWWERLSGLAMTKVPTPRSDVARQSRSPAHTRHRAP